MPAQVEIKNLRKSFGEQRVLNGVDVQVKHGETLAVLGRSGTGKSVLLKLIVGLQKPDAGTIQINGQDIATLDTRQLNDVRKKMGFLFQQAALYDSLSIEENVKFPMTRNGGSKTPPAEIQNKARQLLESVGMKDGLEKLPSQISGGMQKRVGLARALALDPEIILLDEPTAGLDPITSTEIGNLIQELKQKHKMTGIVVTHDVRGARIFADRVLLLDQGSIHAEGTFDELDKSEDPFVRDFLGGD